MFLLKPNSSLLLSSADYTRFAIFLSLLSSYASCIGSIWKASGKTVQEDFFIQSFQLWSDSYFGVSFDFFLFLFLEILIFISYFLTCSFGKLPSGSFSSVLGNPDPHQLFSYLQLRKESFVRSNKLLIFALIFLYVLFLLCVYKISQLFLFFNMEYCINHRMCSCEKYRFALCADICYWHTRLRFAILNMLGGLYKAALFPCFLCLKQWEGFYFCSR